MCWGGRQWFGKVANRKVVFIFTVYCQIGLILKSTCHDKILAKQDVLSLDLHMASLCFSVILVIPINLIATAHLFREWITSVINWLLGHISQPTPTPPTSIHIDLIASRSMRTLQWIFRQRTWFTWNIAIMEENKLFSILNTGIILLQNNSGGDFCEFFSRHPSLDTSSNISNGNFRDTKLQPDSSFSVEG